LLIFNIFREICVQATQISSDARSQIKNLTSLARIYHSSGLRLLIILATNSSHPTYNFISRKIRNFVVPSRQNHQALQGHSAFSFPINKIVLGDPTVISLRSSPQVLLRKVLAIRGASTRLP
jgi:hypothetical protein